MKTIEEQVQEILPLVKGLDFSFPRGIGDDVYLRLADARTGNAARVKITLEETPAAIVASAKKSLKADAGATRRQNRAERSRS